MGRPNCMRNCEKADQSLLLDLELPDWSQLRDSARVVSPAAALKRIEEYYRLFPLAAKASRAQRVIVPMPEFQL